MKKDKKVGSRFQFTETSVKKSELLLAKMRYNKVDPAVFDIFTRLMKRDIEDAMRFDLQTTELAQKFRQSLYSFKHSRKIPCEVKQINNTVYIYRTEEESK